MRTVCLLTFWLGACLALSSDTLANQPARPNIVLVVADDMSPDAGCYGNPVIQTPHLDQLAKEGVLFEQAFCTTASCSASRSVLLTGLHNHANAQYGHSHEYHHFRTYDQVRALPVLLSKSGYRTARVGKLHVEPETVYRFDEALPGSARSPVQMAENCRPFVAAPDGRPFFLYFCTADPHRGGGVVEEDPRRPDRFGNRPQGYPGVDEVTYDPAEVIVPAFLPDTPVCRAELAQYYQSVSRVDQGLGRLIQVLKDSGVYDETLIIFTSDHGIAFPGGKTNVYDAGLRIPLVIRLPEGARAGTRLEAMVSLVDFTPTLLDLAGVRPEAGALHGRSFLPVLQGEPAEDWDRVYASHTFHEVTMYYPMRVVRERQYKLIWNLAHPLPFPFASDLWEAATWQEVYRRGPDALYGMRTVEAYIHRPRFELYDVEKDPNEVQNLADDPRFAQVLQDLQGKLRDFQRRTNDPWLLKWDYE